MPAALMQRHVLLRPLGCLLQCWLCTLGAAMLVHRANKGEDVGLNTGGAHILGPPSV
jgi:hypothetical protein